MSESLSLFLISRLRKAYFYQLDAELLYWYITYYYIFI